MRLLLLPTALFSIALLFSGCENKAERAAAEADLERLRAEYVNLGEELKQVKSEKTEKQKLIRSKSLDKMILELENELELVNNYHAVLEEGGAQHEAIIDQWRDPARRAAAGMVLDPLRIKGGKMVSQATVKSIDEGVITFISRGLEQKEELSNLENSTLLELWNEEAIKGQVPTY